MLFVFLFLVIFVASAAVCCCLMTLLLNSIFGFLIVLCFPCWFLCFNCSDHGASIRTHTCCVHHNRRDRSTVLATIDRPRAVPTVGPAVCAFPKYRKRLEDDSTTTIPPTHLVEGVLQLAVGTPIDLGYLDTAQLSTAQTCDTQQIMRIHWMAVYNNLFELLATPG